MTRGEIVFVKAEVIEHQEGRLLVKVLNGFGEPEINVVQENVLTRDGRDGALVKVAALVMAIGVMGLSACAPRPRPAPSIVAGNIVPDWRHGGQVAAELRPDGNGGFLVITPRVSRFVSAEELRVAQEQKKAAEAAAMKELEERIKKAAPKGSKR